MQLDTFEEIDGTRYLYDAAKPGEKYEVVVLLDGKGDDTEDEDDAAGGVVKIAEECYKIFAFPGHPAIPPSH